MEVFFTDETRLAMWRRHKEFGIVPIDLVIVDLYPFEETVASGGTEEDIIEKIDIGGISLIRGAAKNFADVLIVASTKPVSWTVGVASIKKLFV